MERRQDRSKIEGIPELLGEMGQIPEQLGEIQKQHDPAILSKWHRLAVRSSSIEEFEEKNLK